MYLRSSAASTMCACQLKIKATHLTHLFSMIGQTYRNTKASQYELSAYHAGEQTFRLFHHSILG